MDNEDDWSGIFVTLPGVDKAAHMWGGVNDPGPAGAGCDPMTHLAYAAATADAQVGRIMAELEAERRARQHPGRAHRRPRLGRRGAATSTATACTVADYGFYNWYYGDAENDVYLQPPQEALQPLVDTGNVGLSYSDSCCSVWLNDQSPAKVDRGRRGDHGADARRHRRVAPRR